MIGTRRRGRLGGYCHPVLAGVNVDPSGLRVGHLQAFTRRGLTKVLLFARRHSGLHSRNWKNTEAAGAGGVRKLQFPNRGHAWARHQ